MKKILLIINIFIFTILLSGCSNKVFNESMTSMNTIKNYKVDLTLNIATKTEVNSISFSLKLNGVVDLKNSLAEISTYNKYYGTGVTKDIYLDYNDEVNREYTYDHYNTKTWKETNITKENIIYMPFFLNNYYVLNKKETTNSVVHYLISFEQEQIEEAVKNIFHDMDIKYYSLTNAPSINLYINKGTNLFESITIDLKDCINPDDYNYENLVEFSIEILFSDYDTNEDINIFTNIKTEAEDEKLVMTRNYANEYLQEVMEEIRLNSFTTYNNTKLVYSGNEPQIVDFIIKGTYVESGYMILDNYKFTVENNKITKSEKQ